MRERTYKNNKIIINYFKKNLKEIFMISLVFIIGLIFGVLLINNIKEERKKRNN